MSEPGKAVFLSYASQDAEAARRICDALRAAGVEVWFDADGGLEHGDEWDAKIRRQIKECVLFIPIISANTQAREEGYFRIEWDLAAERARGIASGVAFILPVVIDDTREPDALVPDRFRAVQWTRLRGGAVPPEVLQRFLKLWSHRAGVLKHEEARPSTLPVHAALIVVETTDKPGVKRYALIALAVAVIVCAVGWWLLGGRNQSVAPSSAPVAPANSAQVSAPLSEARQLAEKARVLFDSLDGTRDDYKLAEELIAQAKARDATDAEVCAAEAQLHQRFLQRGWDMSDARREAARAAVQRAIRLDPQSFEVRFAQASLLGQTGREGEERERQLRALLQERPTEQRVLRSLATTLDRLGRLNESAAFARQSAALPGGDPLALYSLSQAYWFAGRANEAVKTMEEAIAQKPFYSALLMSVWYKTTLRGDIAGARQVIARIDPAIMQEDRAAIFAYTTEMFARNPDQAIARLRRVPRDWLADSWYSGPKGLLAGDAHQLASRADAATLEWQTALALVEQRLVESPKDAHALGARVLLLAKLGQRAEAESHLSLLLQLVGADLAQMPGMRQDASRYLVPLGRNAEALRSIDDFIENNPRWPVVFPSATLRLDPRYDPLRGEPEFARIIADVEEREKMTATGEPAAALSPARELAEKARALFQGSDSTREDFALAEDFCERAMKLDSTDGEVWAACSQLHAAYTYRGFDPSPERKDKCRLMAGRAIRLAPASANAKLAQAGAWSAFNVNRDETENLLREVVSERPNDKNALKFLAVTVLGRPDGLDECLALNERAAALPGGDSLALYNNARYLWQRNRPAEAYATLGRSLAQRPFSSALVLMSVMQISWLGDLAAAAATQKQIPPAFHLEDRANYQAGLLAYYQRQPDVALVRWSAFPREFYADFNYAGPKGYLLGLAHELAQRDDAARLERRTALQATERRLAAAPTEPDLLNFIIVLLACLGENTAAETTLRTYEQLIGVGNEPGSVISPGLAHIYLRLGRAEAVLMRLPASLERPGESGMWPARLRLDPRFDPLRNDPRFERLLA